MKLPRLPGSKAAKKQVAPPPPQITDISRAILAGIAMRAGNIVLKRTVDRGILGRAPETLRKAARAIGIGQAETTEAKPTAPQKPPADSAADEQAAAAKPAVQTIAKAAATAAGLAGRGIGARLLTTAATRIATRSVPGAIVVGGALLAKTLHERRKNRKG